MISDLDPVVSGVLTQQELESIQLAQDIYGGRAKEAAAELASTLGLDENAKKQLVGGVALHLHGLDFEERRQVALGFKQLAEGLGKAALNGDSSVGHSSTLDLIINSSDVNGASENGHDPAATNGNVDSLTEQEESTDTEASLHEVITPDNPLNKTQRSWLNRLYDASDVNRIEALNPAQRSAFVKALTNKYQKLKITRLGAQAKSERSAQLTSIMEGTSIDELASQLGIQEGTLRAGLNKMAGSISKRMTPSELRRLVTNAEKKTEAPKRQSASQLDISEQRNEWLGKLVDPQAAATFEEMTADERRNFAEKLGGVYQGLRIPRLEAAGRVKRIDLITGFLTGASIDELQRITGVSHPYKVTTLLENILNNFDTRVEKSALAELMGYSRQDRGEDTEPEIEASTVEEAEKQEPEEFELSELQAKWFAKFLKPDHLDAIEKLSTEQVDYLAERLCQRVSALVVRSQGSVRTHRRLEEIKLLISGRDYDQISEAVKVDVKTVKAELHHSAMRLKVAVPPVGMHRIMQEVIEYSVKK